MMALRTKDDAEFENYECLLFRALFLFRGGGLIEVAKNTEFEENICRKPISQHPGLGPGLHVG